MITISHLCLHRNHAAFGDVTHAQAHALTGNWINGIAIVDTASELGLPVPLVTAWYGIRDIEFFESEGNWPTYVP